MVRTLEDNGKLAPVLFVPASLGALVFGILLTIEGSWGFERLWVVHGLAGFATTFAIGLFILKPRSARIAAMIARDGGVSETAIAAGRQLLLIGRVDLVILYLVLANMVLKPLPDDVAILSAMAGVLVISVTAILLMARSMGGRAALAPAE